MSLFFFYIKGGLANRKPKICKFLGSYRYCKFAHFLGVPVCKSQIRKFSRCACPLIPNTQIFYLKHGGGNISFKKFNLFCVISRQNHLKVGCKFLRPNSFFYEVQYKFDLKHFKSIFFGAKHYIFVDFWKFLVRKKLGPQIVNPQIAIFVEVSANPVLRIRIRDLESGIRCIFDHRIRDPE
jgi:hypothetical protein